MQVRYWMKRVGAMAVVCCLLMLLFASGSVGAQSAEKSLWQDAPDPAVRAATRQIVPDRYRTLALDVVTMRTRLASAPLETFGQGRTIGMEIALPLPDGGFGRFSLHTSPIMEPALAAKFPDIQTFVGQGLDDPTATVRLDITPDGLHAAIFSAETTIYIDPFSSSADTHYISYKTSDMRAPQPFIEHGVIGLPAPEEASRLADPVSVGPTLRQYRLAVAAVGEYTAFHGGTVADGMSAIVTAINRVTGIYEREVAIRFILVGNNDAIIYTNGATDPYTNGNAGALLSENQTNLDAVIGSANYDIGHVFNTGGGGLAGLGVVCNGARKAQGETGRGAPIGDPFYVDYVAHEIGHQFGGSHTFNGNGSACNGNRSASSAYEPGSGSTIQAYAGICGSQNLQSNSDDYFHTRSFDQMVTYSRNGIGSSCGVDIATGNRTPIPDAGTGGFTIPASTPFELTGSATDPDGDTLTYNWEQYDLGTSAGASSATQGPFFRSWYAENDAVRNFPRLSDLLQNTTNYGENLPSISTTLNFRMTVRDNRASGGGVAYDTLTFDVSNGAGPFVVTAPNGGESWPAGDARNVTWSVAGSDQPPVSCAYVDILLSTDGGETFPTLLALQVPNDGSHPIFVPDTQSSTARVRVACSDNIFFDVSNQDFTIAPPEDGFLVDFELTSAETCLGTDAQFALNISKLSNFNQSVALSITSPPSTAAFTPASGTPPFASTLTLTEPPVGTHNLTAVGSGGGQTRNDVLQLTVREPFTPPVILAPASDATDVDLRPTLSWTDIGAASYTVTVGLDAALSNTVFQTVVNGSSLMLTPELPRNVTHYWRVEAANVCGSVSTPVASFTTADRSLRCGVTESFEDGIPSDWEVVTVAGRGWTTTDGSFCGSGSAELGTGENYAGSGTAACADSDAVGSQSNTDTYLCTPALNLHNLSAAELTFTLNYQVFNTPDSGDRFALLASGASAAGPYDAPLFSVATDYPSGTAQGVEGSGSAETVALTDYLGDSSAYVCFHYQGDYDWYAHVDDVTLSCEAETPTAVTLQPTTPSESRASMLFRVMVLGVLMTAPLLLRGLRHRR